jgi:hypothetical protein
LRRVTDRRVPCLMDFAGGGFPRSKSRPAYPAGGTIEHDASDGSVGAAAASIDRLMGVKNP